MTYLKRPRASTLGTACGALGLLFLSSVAFFAACGDDDDAGGDAGSGGVSGEGGQGGVTTIDRPNRFRVRLDDDKAPAVVLKMDKKKALEVFGETGAKRITILEVDTEPLLKNALAVIQNACGTDWSKDAVNPKHDCLGTGANDLGKSFGPNWRTSPEFALVRLLTMTPANADVTGTSLEDFQKLIDENPSTFAFSFADVLAESMGIARTAPFVPTEQLVAALQQQLFAGHPAVSDPEGKRMSVSLYEALKDLAPLATKLGPVGARPWAAPGEHPGILVPDDGTFTTTSNVMLPEFQMQVVAESGLRRVAGVDLARGGGDMYVRTADVPLKFDFNDPAKLAISGLAAAPTIDMRFAMRELDGLVPSCVSPIDPQNPGAPKPCQGNLPGTPVGVGTVWTQKPFLLEPIVARAAMLTFGEQRYDRCYIQSGGKCITGVFIGHKDDTATPNDDAFVGLPGWTVFTNDLKLGGEQLKAPEPQYLWELLTEVAQISVHDPGGDGAAGNIAEGKAEPVYGLKGVGIGMTADEILAKLRPTLQSQAADIADIILGRYWLNNDPIDFYYGRDAPGVEPYLYFVAESDLRPDDQKSTTPRPYGYTKPGFFSDPGLTTIVSSKTVEGVADTSHEKYKLPRGPSTLYMQGDGGAVYRVDFYVPEDGDPIEISAEVTKL